MNISVVTSKGSLLIPLVIRRKFGIKKGTKVAFIEQGDKVIMQPLNKNYFNKLAGVLDEKGKMLKSLMDREQRVFYIILYILYVQ